MSAPGDPSGCTGLSWTYDLWGNRTDQSVTAGSCSTFHATVNTANRLIDPVNGAYQYDAAGNMTHDANHTYFYDAENRTIQVDGTLGNCAAATACYAYDAEGRRIQKTAGSVVTQYVYDVDGQVIHEADAAGNFTAYYIPFAGQLLAQYKNSTTQFIHKDHLGSTRLVTGMTNPSTPVDTLDFLPFGEQLAGDTATTHKFTGKERDTESGLNNFAARFDSSSMGRFMSVDPDNASASSGDPQSWNAYSYVRNNPLSLTDSDGRIFCRPARESEKETGVTLVCDVTNTQYVFNSKLYDALGYKHYDCSCDTGYDKDAWDQFRAGGAGPDILGDFL